MLIKENLKQFPKFDQETNELRAELHFKSIAGNSTDTIITTITFDSSFNQVLGAIATGGVTDTTGSMTDITDSNATTKKVLTTIGAVSNSSCTIQMWRPDGTTFNSSYKYGFTLYVIGER